MTPKVIRGAGFRGVLNYILSDRETVDGGDAPPVIIAGNMSSRDARGLAREFGAARKLRPDAKRPVWHCPLSLPPGEKVSPEKFAAVADDFMKQMGFSESHQYVVVLHSEKQHLHAHIVANRIGIDGKLWHGEREAIRAIAACRELETRHGLRAVPMPDKRKREKPEPTPTDSLPAATVARDPALRAQRRAQRRGTRQNDPHALRVAALDALSRSTSHDELARNLARLGVEVEFATRGEPPQPYGWKLRFAGADEWLSASSVHRSLAWSRASAALEQNREQQELATKQTHMNLPTQRPAGQAEPAARAQEALRLSSQVDAALGRLKPNDLARLRAAVEGEQMSDGDAIAALARRLLDFIVRILSLGTVGLPPTAAEQREAARRQLLQRIDAEQQRRDQERAAADEARRAQQPREQLTVVRTHDARPSRPAAGAGEDDAADPDRYERERGG